MLCERCQEREATVHVTLVLGLGAEITRHDFCDFCHPLAEAERVKSYASLPRSPLLEDVEHISASEYLQAFARAARNGVDKPAFRHIQEELDRFPATRQRLVFEMLRLTWQSLERGQEPGWAAGFVGCSWGSIEPQRLSEFSLWLERIILRCFELRSGLASSPGEHGPFTMTLSATLLALGKVDRGRFAAVLDTLKDRGADPNLDPRWKVIARVQEAVLKSERRDQ